MGIFFKKIKKLLTDKPEPDTIQPESLGSQKFSTHTYNFKVASLFVIDPVPTGGMPVYDLDGGEKEIIYLEDGKPKHIKTELTRITLPLQANVTEKEIIECLSLATKYVQTIDNVDEYKNTGGWALLSGNKLEDRLYNNIYLKDFPRTLFFPEPQYAGLISVCDGGVGFFMILEKVRILRE